jgi:hypothetical protein
MDAVVVRFDDETPEEIQAGIAYVETEVVPFLSDDARVHGIWLVDHESGRRLTVLSWDDEGDFQAAMNELRAAHDPSPTHPEPTSVSNWHVYGIV